MSADSEDWLIPERNGAEFLVLGLGNTLMGDDGIGIYLARMLEERFKNIPAVCVQETPLAGMNLIRIMEGFGSAVLIDAIRTSDCEPGRMHRLDLADFETTNHIVSPHWTNIFTAMYIARRHDFEVPSKVTVFAIEINEQSEVSEQCSEEIFSKIPSIADEIYEFVMSQMKR